MMQDALQRVYRPGAGGAHRLHRQAESYLKDADFNRLPRHEPPVAEHQAQPRGSRSGKEQRARIFKPTPSPMQSGRANTRRWVLEFEPQTPLFIEPLMGWTGSTDPLRHVRLTFPDRESAIRFAERQGYAFTVIEPKERRVRPKSYADKFRPRPSNASVGGGPWRG